MKQPVKQFSGALSILVVCAGLCAAPGSNAQLRVEDDQSAAFTIVGARVFDGERWLPPGTQVRVQHGLVLAVGPDVGLARGGTIIDGSGKALLPEQGEGEPGHAGDSAPDRPLAEKVQSGHGAIIPGAYADLRLVEGDIGQGWSGLGAISARWKNGVLIGRHTSAAKNL
jgi:hypothetical protein